MLRGVEDYFDILQKYSRPAGLLIFAEAGGFEPPRACALPP